VAFDFDNTIVTGDIGEATLAVLVRRGLVKASRLPESTSPSYRNAAGRLIDPQDEPDLTCYYEALLDSTVHGPKDANAFATGYVWAVEAMAGLPLTRLVEATAEAFSISVPGRLAPIEVTRGRTAYPAPFFNPEIVELIARLIEHRFDVWVVSASNVWSVRWMIQHGLNPRLRERGVATGIPPSRVVGVATLLTDHRRHLYKDAVLAREDAAYAAMDPAALKPYRLTSRLQFPVPTYSGKVACLWDALRTRPVLAAGDSPGDHAMLSFATHRLWIARLEKPAYQASTAALMRETGPDSWLVQPALAKPRPGFQPRAEPPEDASEAARQRILESTGLLGLT
jgi:phosphoserine phosphatase